MNEKTTAPPGTTKRMSGCPSELPFEIIALMRHRLEEAGLSARALDFAIIFEALLQVTLDVHWPKEQHEGLRAGIHKASLPLATAISAEAAARRRKGAH